MSKPFWVLVGIALGAASAWGADAGTGVEKDAPAVTEAAGTPRAEDVVVERLSEELGLPAETLRAQREATGLGWGGLLVANRLARATGLTLDQVVAEFRGGSGWGAIARAHGVDLGALVSEVRAAPEAALRGGQARAAAAGAQGHDGDRGHQGQGAGRGSVGAGGPGEGRGGGASGAGGGGGNGGGRGGR